MIALLTPRHNAIATDRQHHEVTAERLRAMSVSNELAFERCVWTNIRQSNAESHAFPSVENPSSVYWIVTADRVVLIYPKKPHTFEPHERFHIEYRKGWFSVWTSPGWTRTFVVEQFTRTADETLQQSVARALARHYIPAMQMRPLTYKPVTSAPVGAFQSVATDWVTTNNPYGYNGDARRIDLPGGGNRWWQTMASYSTEHGCQGHIIWAFRQNPHGCMYRPDAWREYVTVRPQVQEIMRQANNVGQWIGCTLRPGKMVRPNSENPLLDVLTDTSTTSDHTYQVANLNYLLDAGFEHFYVDEPVDVQLLSQLRFAAGASVNLFLESSTTEHLPLGSLYHEPGAKTPHNPEWFVWLARLIYPNISVAVKPRRDAADAAGFSEIVEDWQWSSRPQRKAEAASKEGS